MIRRALAAAVGLLVAAAPCAAAPSLERAEQAAIADVMRSERGKGYDVTATANAMRLQVAVITRLVREAQQGASEQSPLLIGSREYFAAFLAATELSEEQAPSFIRVAHDHGEDLIVEYRPGKVMRRVRRGAAPQLAMTVCGGWSAATPPSYSYEDTTSSPHVRSIHDRVNSYRLLDFGTSVMHDEIAGIGGRATSGFLGALFNVLGDAHAVRSRMAVAPDGTQLVVATARKGISVTQDVRISPDGHTEAGLPDGRPDLVALRKLLTQPVEIEYVPFECRPGEAILSQPSP